MAGPGPGGPRSLDRTFDAIVFDWDGTAVPDRHADAGRVRDAVEALTAAAVDVVVVSGTHVGNIDGQLKARPPGPGRLLFALNRGSEVFECDADGPRTLHRRSATLDEEDALDEAAAAVVAALSDAGLDGVRVVSSRLNRRKIDLIAAWNDPPKSVLPALVRAVAERLATAGLDLPGVVELARAEAVRAGLADPRVTSDAKHVEIGLTDKSHSLAWVLDELVDDGVAPGGVLIAGDEFGPLGGAQGSDALMMVHAASRATVVSVGPEPDGVPDGVIHLGGGPERFLRLLDDQVARRRSGELPVLDDDPAWTLPLSGARERRRVEEALATVADGRIGTRGATEETPRGSHPMVLAAGVYDDRERVPQLLPGPIWTSLDVEVSDQPARALDIRHGILWRDGRLRSLRFASRARPGTMVLWASGPAGQVRPGRSLRPPLEPVPFDTDALTDATWAHTETDPGGSISAVAADDVSSAGGRTTIGRVAVYSAAPSRAPHPGGIEALREAMADGPAVLLREHRRAWARRWRTASIAIEGDPETERLVRLAMFHLMASASDDDEVVLGARGLSGPVYGGRVFWDADVFALPFFAATHPATARGLLAYRVARTPAARRAAQVGGHQGLRLPWESAGDGSDVTPSWAPDPGGGVRAIRTGELEEHITADVAWAADAYARWTGDGEVLHGAARPLIVGTAAYWASRIEAGRDGGHIRGVIGPDEYHVGVDDDAFTNIMARWNLERAAALVASEGDVELARRWRSLAASLVDGHDQTTGVYEQFAGYHSLEDVPMSAVGRPPVAADLLLGVQRIAETQIIKQPSVLMAHHLVPSATAPDSLGPNLDHYGPRTAHGSSLSPAIHASLAARAGRSEEALAMFTLACRLDVDDLTGTTAGGLHLATYGGIWQALVLGFAGIDAAPDGVLEVDPRLPDGWDALEIRLVFRRAHVRARLANDAITIEVDRPISVRASGGPVAVIPAPRARAHRDEAGWRWEGG